MLAFLSNPQVSIGRSELRQKYPNVSFPADLEKADLASYGVIKIKEQPAPSCNHRTERVVERPVELVNGVWVKGWEVQPLPLEQQQQLLANQAQRMRQQRDLLLTACDWTQLADVKLDIKQQSDWRKYRQALRDVPLQNGFPWDVTWPTQP